MTLIAFATYPDRAELITDTASYTRHVEQLGRSANKHVALDAIGAVVATGGAVAFCDLARDYALQAAAQVLTFDHLVTTAPQWLAQAARDAGNPETCTALLVGYSETADAFVGYTAATETGWVPLLEAAHLQPTPWTLAPSLLEATRLASDRAEDPDLATVLDLWTAKPPLTPPASVGAWIQLAEACRDQRGHGADYAQTVVHGDLIHITLEHNAITSRRVHTFPDDPETMATMLAGTHHPIAQMQPCWCNSGQTYAACHLRPHWGQPCGCASGKTFEDCCLVATSSDHPAPASAGR